MVAIVRVFDIGVMIGFFLLLINQLQRNRVEMRLQYLWIAVCLGFSL